MCWDNQFPESYVKEPLATRIYRIFNENIRYYRESDVGTILWDLSAIVNSCIFIAGAIMAGITYNPMWLLLWIYCVVWWTVFMIYSTYDVEKQLNNKEQQ